MSPHPGLASTLDSPRPGTFDSWGQLGYLTRTWTNSCEGILQRSKTRWAALATLPVVVLLISAAYWSTGTSDSDSGSASGLSAIARIVGYSTPTWTPTSTYTPSPSPTATLTPTPTPTPRLLPSPTAEREAVPEPTTDYADQLEEWNPGNFDDPTNIDNQWLPMKPGTRWTYEGSTEKSGLTIPHRIVFTVTDLTKVINGVRTVVAHAVDISNGQPIEREIAFYAQDNDGNVW